MERLHISSDADAKVTVSVFQPGNGTKYVIVTGLANRGDEPFVAIPNLNRAAVMALRPNTWQYVAEKLDLRQPDAEVVLEYLHEIAGMA